MEILTLKLLKSLHRYLTYTELSKAIDYNVASLTLRLKRNKEFDVKTAKTKYKLLEEYLNKNHNILLPLLKNN